MFKYLSEKEFKFRYQVNIIKAYKEQFQQVAFIF